MSNSSRGNSGKGGKTGGSSHSGPGKSGSSSKEPRVNYHGKTVSDPSVRKVLGRVASDVRANVNVSSGDRSSVPRGGSPKSHHLEHRAADFHVSGRTDKAVFGQLKAYKKSIFDKNHKYQVILHGPFTATTGPHVHIGRYKDGKGVVFYKEGTTKGTKGKYERVKSK
jgi:hypothetical protein